MFTNKYAEGYPGRRYYGGCEYADVVENLARDRAKQLFGAEHANVQPHSGSQANMEAYMAVLKPGDTILGLNLAHGGHLTHGHQLNFSGKTYQIVPYGVTKDTETIDYDELEQIAEREKPKVIIGGGSAYPRIIDFARMRQIADKVGALFMVDMAHFAGLVAGGAHPSPVPHAHIVTTTTHKTLRGPRAGMILVAKQEFAAAIDKTVFPGDRVDRSCTSSRPRRCASLRRCSRSSRTMRRRSSPMPRRLAQRLPDEGFRIISGGTDTHLDAGGCLLQGNAGQRSREGSRRGRHHGQQECHSVRYQSAAEAQRHPHRHTGANHARHERKGNAPDRPVDRRGAASTAPTPPCSAGSASRCWSWRSRFRSIRSAGRGLRPPSRFSARARNSCQRSAVSIQPPRLQLDQALRILKSLATPGTGRLVRPAPESGNLHRSDPAPKSSSRRPPARECFSLRVRSFARLSFSVPPLLSPTPGAVVRGVSAHILGGFKVVEHMAAFQEVAWPAAGDQVFGLLRPPASPRHHEVDAHLQRVFKTRIAVQATILTTIVVPFRNAFWPHRE